MCLRHGSKGVPYFAVEYIFFLKLQLNKNLEVSLFATDSRELIDSFRFSLFNVGNYYFDSLESTCADNGPH